MKQGNALPEVSIPLLAPILPGTFDRFSQKCLQDAPTQNDTPLQARARRALDLANSPLTQPTLVHPEGGSVYAVESLVSDLPISSRLRSVGDHILNRCSQADLRDITVFLRFRGIHVEYYVVDHCKETVVWLNDQRPDELRGQTESRIKNVSNEEYWAHMEAIPGARFVSASSMSQLKNVLSSLAIDSATSDGSTSPFSYGQIQDFLQILNGFSETNIDEYQTFSVARIWNMIWHARVINNFGGENPCLDRFMVLSTHPPAFTGLNATLALATLGAADKTLVRCARAWAGRIAYVGEWKQYKTKNETEWQQVVQLASATVIASLLLSDSYSSKILATTSTLLSLAAAAYGYHLVTESQNLGDHAADASVHFQKWEHPEYNVQRIALRNAAPQALLGWAFIAFVGSVLRIL